MDRHRSFAFGFSLLVAACGGAAGCQESKPKIFELGKTQQALEALVPLDGCGEVEAYLRERLVADVNRAVDRAIDQIRKSEYAGCYGGAFSGNGGSGGSSGSSGSSGSDGQATSTSKTNNQVAGVDEADFVKNDAKYLYVAANGAFRIIQAWPAETSVQVAKVPLEGEPRKLFVEGDRALVYVAVPSPPKPDSPSGSFYSSGGECTYGYDCIPTGDGTQTKILVFDIANRAAPMKIREIDLSGSLLAARRIGNAVHTVVVDAMGQIDGIQRFPDMSKHRCDVQSDTNVQKAVMVEAWEDLRKENLALIARADILATLPTVKEGSGRAVPACEGYYRPSVAEGATFTTLLSVDLASRTGGARASTIVSDPGVVYASETGLYMSVPHDRSAAFGWYDGMDGEEQASTVHKFRIGATPALTGYEASGVVKGRVLNQFALDEYDAHLRVATTTGHVPAPGVHSTMSVLERRDQSLVLTGKVDNIAPSEDIRSVRFDGPRGFVVTFKKTDPLYVFDLGNPNAPSIAGELKIPGFSTYMHMMDAQHLLTIGYDAADQGSFAWFQGVMLQIFDVSDMKNPRLAHKEVIGTRGSSSEALTNHLAFNYYREKNLLAFPMTVCEGGDGGGGYGTNMTFSGLMVYTVTPAAGFSKRGEVPHPNTSSGTRYDSTGCGNWWTNARSEVKRSIMMDDFVYSISDRRVKVNGLSNLGSDVAVVALDQ